MFLTWLKAQDAAEAGAALADSFPGQTTSEFLREFVQRAASELQARKLNFYKRARFANAFKWRLLEKGVSVETAHDITQTLLITSSTQIPGPQAAAAAVAPKPALPTKLPKDTAELMQLGVELSQKGQYSEARKCFQKILTRNPNNTEAMCHLGALCAGLGRFADAENYYRRALRQKATDLYIRTSLGQVLVYQGLLDKARTEFEKVLKNSPRHALALSGLGSVERGAGHFAAAEQQFRRALEADPALTAALAGIAGTRRMTAADGPWLAKAQEVATKTQGTANEAHLRLLWANTSMTSGTTRRHSKTTSAPTRCANHLPLPTMKLNTRGL